MKQPVVPMTKEKWIELATGLKYGDMIFVLTDDLSGEVIEWGSADNGSPDPNGFTPFLCPAHVFRYLGLGRGATVEADPKGTSWHLIDEYRDRVISGAVRLIIIRHEDLTVGEFESIKAECERQVGKPYGWGAIIGFGLVKIFRETFIGNIWRWFKWQTPFCDRNAPVCSQGVLLQENTVKRFLDMFSFLKVDNATPQADLDAFLKVKLPIVIDSFKIASIDKDKSVFLNKPVSAE